MPKILSTGRQYIITISPEIMKTMGWEKGTELILSKVPGQKQVYLEEVLETKKSPKAKSKVKRKTSKKKAKDKKKTKKKRKARAKNKIEKKRTKTEQPKLHYPHGGVL